MKNFLNAARFILMITLSTGCSSPPTNEIYFDRESIVGCWEKVVQEERYVFSIEQYSDGSYTGSITTCRDEQAVEKMALSDIACTAFTVSMITNVKHHIIFKGTLDTAAQMIKGKLYYKNGTEYPFDLKRCGNPNQIMKPVVDRQREFRYKPADQLPPVVPVSSREISIRAGSSKPPAGQEDVSREDAIAVINRWHGNIYPAHPERSTALLLAFMTDPVTRDVVDSWQEIMRPVTTAEKVGAINQWTTQHMGYTQAQPEFFNYPGKDPWGTFPGSTQPTFKKLIPAGMNAMRLYSGKISGKCFTLVNLIISGFMLSGVSPDDIVVLIVKSGDARHAMGLVKYEGRLVLVNLMMVGMLEAYIQKDFGNYDIMGIYNLNFSQKADLRITRPDLEAIIRGASGSPLEQVFAEHYHLHLNRLNTGVQPLTYENLRRQIFENSVDTPLFRLVKYAAQSLDVLHPEYFLEASLESSLPRDLAPELRTEEEIFSWIRTHIRYGSIFRESENHLMTADQVLVFQQGSYKDQAVLACTLLKHKGKDAVIEVTEDNAFIRSGGQIYDFKAGMYINSPPANSILTLN